MRLGLWGRIDGYRKDFPALAACLRRARALVAGGWVAGLSRDSQGWICDPHDEGVLKFGLHHALDVSTERTDVAMAAEELMQLLADPSHQITLYDWEDAPGRTHAEVLALFSRAIERAEALRRSVQTFAHLGAP